MEEPDPAPPTEEIPSRHDADPDSAVDVELPETSTHPAYLKKLSRLYTTTWGDFSSYGEPGVETVLTLAVNIRELRQLLTCVLCPKLICSDDCMPKFDCMHICCNGCKPEDMASFCPRRDANCCDKVDGPEGELFSLYVGSFNMLCQIVVSKRKYHQLIERAAKDYQDFDGLWLVDTLKEAALNSMRQTLRSFSTPVAASARNAMIQSASTGCSRRNNHLQASSPPVCALATPSASNHSASPSKTPKSYVSPTKRPTSPSKAISSPSKCTPTTSNKNIPSASSSKEGSGLPNKSRSKGGGGEASNSDDEDSDSDDDEKRFAGYIIPEEFREVYIRSQSLGKNWPTQEEIAERLANGTISHGFPPKSKRQRRRKLADQKKEQAISLPKAGETSNAGVRKLKGSAGGQASNSNEQMDSKSEEDSESEDDEKRFAGYIIPEEFREVYIRSQSLGKNWPTQQEIAKRLANGTISHGFPPKPKRKRRGELADQKKEQVVFLENTGQSADTGVGGDGVALDEPELAMQNSEPEDTNNDDGVPQVPAVRARHSSASTVLCESPLNPREEENVSPNAAAVSVAGESTEAGVRTLKARLPKEPKTSKNKKGCRCGNAAINPGKLTCCGQRCPCYVENKNCSDCRCKGCRNPFLGDGSGRKLIPGIKAVQTSDARTNVATSLPLQSNLFGLNVAGPSSSFFQPINPAMYGNYCVPYAIVQPTPVSVVAPFKPDEPSPGNTTDRRTN